MFRIVDLIAAPNPETPGRSRSAMKRSDLSPVFLAIALCVATPSADAQGAGCTDGKLVLRVIREPGSQQIEPIGGRQDPALPLGEAPRESGTLKDWRLIAPLIRALDPMTLGASMRPALEAAVRAEGCQVVDAKEDLWKAGNSLEWFNSVLATAKWRGENYDYLLVRAVPAIVADGNQLVLHSRVVLLRSKGMQRPEPFDLEHRSAPLPGDDPAARVAGLAADGAKRFIEWRAAALAEVVSLAFSGPVAASATRIEDPRWRRQGTVVSEAAGRTIVKFEGRYVSAPNGSGWRPDGATAPMEEP